MIRPVRQAATLLQPVRHPLRSRVVGSRHQPEIAEEGAQRAQQLPRCRQRVARIERIDAEPVGDVGHELRNAHGAHPADRRAVEIAFAPDQIGEEADRKRIGLRDRDQPGADVVIRQSRRIRPGEGGPGTLERCRPSIPSSA